MPLYEYQCEKCGRFERIVKFSDPPLAACPTCGGTVQKLFSSPAIQFKGSGFYITDYPKKSSSESSGSSKSSSDKSSSEKSSSDKSSGEKSSGEKSDKSSSDSSSSSPAAPAAATTSKD
jgi:putative FmdB family regulatory protein